MASTDVKIRSNSYAKQVEYFTREADGDWQPLEHRENDSKLSAEKFTSGFLSLHAQELLSTINEEFADRENPTPVVVFFEGSDDEYCELELAAGSAGLLGKIDLRQESRHLANAREILPLIKGEFDSVRVLIEDVAQSDEGVSLALDRFDDATSTSVPVCVVGNYSAGKSTFINALIGHELLPNGEDPVTAKLYKISRAASGYGSIRFGIGEARYELLFSESSESVQGLDEVPEAIRNAMTGETGMIAQMADALAAINSYEPGENGPVMEDQIDVEVPFNGIEAWSDTLDLVIFDTPGNGSKSNADHIEVLHNAMDRMSNGLAVFVGTRESLDSVDGADLCERVKGIEALDDRFAIIVVNKADEAGLPKKDLSGTDKARIMGQAIPRIMPGQGLFFVSSILALGAKTSGEFVSDVYAEKYDEKSAKYVDKDNRYYKELYRYNLMPERLKEHAVENAQACPNLLFANSGLTCVEQAIAEFAEKHSAYNKCQQAEGLFGQAAAGTQSALLEEREEAEAMRAERKEKLDAASLALIASVETESAAFAGARKDEYPAKKESLSRQLLPHIDKDELSAREEELTIAERKANGYVEQDAKAGLSFKAIGENFLDDMRSVFSDADPSKILDAFGGLTDDAKEHFADVEQRRDLSSQADRRVAEMLFSEVKQRFADEVDAACTGIEQGSKQFWEQAASDFKESLCKVVAADSALPQDKRDVIMNAIVSYEDLDLSKLQEGSFDKDDLMQSFRIGDIKFWVGEKLDKPRLAKRYNELMVDGIVNWSFDVGQSHAGSFGTWLGNLTKLVTDNIAEFNAELVELNEQIRQLEDKIADRESKLAALQSARDEVQKLMAWHERA